MAERLQEFSYRDSPYLRPNQDWVCGRLAEGCPCAIGPDDKGNCRATFECQPRRDGGRWQCTRSPFAGGPCESGPLPDGTCCNAIPKCSPVRSWRAKRGATVKWLTAVTIGLLMVLLTVSDQGAFINPGSLTTKHAELGSCATCHSAFEKGATGWLHAAFGTSMAGEDSGRCLSCHKLGDSGLSPHSLPAPTLASLSADAAPATIQGGDSDLTLARMFPPRPAEGEELACMTCHREHHGASFDLTAMSNSRCQTCHQAQFGSFSRGHPDFGAYPYDRRTRIQFDHASHIGKHFRSDQYSDVAPADCNSCHEPDAYGRRMVVKGFEATCSACHAGQIAGAGRAGAKGIAVLKLPGLDVYSLQDRETAIGEWPEFAEGPVTPFMDLLMAGDENYVAAREALDGVNLLDLADASDEQIEHVEKLAWSIKGLLFDLRVNGVGELAERLDVAMGHEMPGEMKIQLFALLPADSLRVAQQLWLPSLMAEVPLARDGQRIETSIPVAREEEEEAEEDDEEEDEEDEDEEDEESAEADEDEEEDEEDADEEAEEENGVPEVEMASEEDWQALGGWYRDDFAFALRYRPVGHADPFLKAWIEASRSASDSSMPGAVFEDLVDPGAPGSCVKCHSIDAGIDAGAGNGLVVNWRGARPEPGKREFTAYSHTAHFSLLDEKGCFKCHQMNPEADFAAGYKDRDAATFASNFQPLERAVCADCHTEFQAGNSCVKCHNYHVGTFPPAMVTTEGMMSAAKSE